MGKEKKHRFSWKWILSGIVIVAVVLVGVRIYFQHSSGGAQDYLWHKGQAAQVKKSAEREKEFVIGGSDIPADPHICLQYGETAQRICRLVYEPLVSVSAAKEVHPVLAQKVTFSEDGLTAEVTLGNKTFSDGSPVTAQDVLESYRILNEPFSHNPLKPVMGAIEGMEAFQNGEGEDFGVQVLAEDRLQFRFRSVSVNNLEALSAPVVKKTEEGIFVLGTGDYRLESMQGLVEVRLSRNPQGAADLPYEQITFVNATSQKIQNSVEDFSIDAVQISADGIGKLLKESGCYDIYAYPAEGCSYLTFPADASLAVRQTVNSVFDSDAFWKEMETIVGTEGAYASASGLVSPTYEGRTRFGADKNPDKYVKQLQKERQEAVLTFLLDGSTLSRSRFQILAEQFAEHGVKLEPVVGDGNQEQVSYDFTFSAADPRTPEQLMEDGAADETAQAFADSIAQQLNRNYRKVYESAEKQLGDVMPAVPAGVQTTYLAVLSDCRDSRMLEILMG